MAERLICDEGATIAVTRGGGVFSCPPAPFVVVDTDDVVVKGGMMVGFGVDVDDGTNLGGVVVLTTLLLLFVGLDESSQDDDGLYGEPGESDESLDAVLESVQLRVATPL